MYIIRKQPKKTIWIILVVNTEAGNRHWYMQQESIYLQDKKNGKIVAKLVTAKVDKKATLDHLLGLFPQGLDVDLEQEREERLSKK